MRRRPVAVHRLLAGGGLVAWRKVVPDKRSDRVETISRRNVIGLAAGVVAGGVLAAEQASKAVEKDDGAKPGEPTAANSDSIYKFRMGTAPAHRYGESF